MVTGKDQVYKGVFDILCLAMESFVSDEGKGKRSSEARVEVEEDSLWATKSFSLRKRKLDEHYGQNPQQNPNDVTSSSRSYPIEYERRLVVPNEEAVSEVEPIREVEPPVREIERVRREEEEEDEERMITPEWLVNLMKEENGFDAKRIFEKVLTKTDLAKHHNRLLIPMNKIVDHEFLNEEDMRIIMEHYRKQRNKGLDVIFVGSDGQKCELNFRRWDMKSSSNYVLVSGWHNVVVDNRLRVGQTIHLWSFHSPQKLFFALAPPNPAPAMALGPAQAPNPALDLTLALGPAPIPAQAPDPALALTLALVPAPTEAPALGLALPLFSDNVPTVKRRKRSHQVFSKNSDKRYTYLEDDERIVFANNAKRKRSIRVPVPPPDPASRVSDHDAPIRREDPIYHMAVYAEWLLANL